MGWVRRAASKCTIHSTIRGSFSRDYATGALANKPRVDGRRRDSCVACGRLSNLTKIRTGARLGRSDGPTKIPPQLPRRHIYFPHIYPRSLVTNHTTVDRVSMPKIVTSYLAIPLTMKIVIVFQSPPSAIIGRHHNSVSQASSVWGDWGYDKLNGVPGRPLYSSRYIFRRLGTSRV